MSRLLKRAAIVFVAVFVAVFAAAQLVRPEHTNPTTDVSRTIQARLGAASELATVLDRACNDCHSNETIWSHYPQVAPVSWVMAYGVNQGRKAVNFSEWAAYPPEQQRALLVVSCRDASEGKMPPRLYTLMHPEARLSAQDVETICAAARQVEASPAGVSQ
jgi:heme-binding protein